VAGHAEFPRVAGADKRNKEAEVEYEHEAQVFNFMAGLILGAVIGAGIAVLTTPEAGKRTRRRIRRAASDIRGTAEERLEELSDEMKGRVDEVVKVARKRFS